VSWQAIAISCILIIKIGGPTAAVMAFQNPHINVTVVDRDPIRIKQWKTKHLPIYEPGLYEILRIARDGSKACSFYNEATRSDSLDSMSSASSSTSECESQCGDHRDEIAIQGRTPNLFFSTEVSKTISEADIVLIAVNTPTKDAGHGFGEGNRCDSFGSRDARNRHPRQAWSNHRRKEYCAL
jgi:UDPglucose 6-dehydrogenase